MSNTVTNNILHAFIQQANLTHALSNDEIVDLTRICALIGNDAQASKWAALHASAKGLRSTRLALEQALPPLSRRSTGALRRAMWTGALECALSTLPVSLYQFLCRLAIFAEGWTLTAACVVCAEAQTSEWCADLEQKGLLCADGTRPEASYRLIAGMRERLKAHLEPEVWKQLQQAHLHYFAALAAQARPHLRFTADEQWLTRLNVEKANLLQAFNASRGKTSIDFALNLWRWGHRCTHYEETLRMLHAARFACSPFPADRLAEIYRAIGSLYYRQDKYILAEGYLKAAHAVASQNAQEEEAAFALLVLGFVLRDLHRLEEAQLCQQECLCLWRTVGVKWGEASALNELGIIAWKRACYDEAHAFFKLSVALFTYIQDHGPMASVLLNRGLLAETCGEYAVAEKAYAQSLASVRHSLSKAEIECTLLNNMGVIHFKTQRYSEARDYFCQALRKKMEMKVTSTMPGVLATLGETLHYLGNDKLAVYCLGAAEKLDPQYKQDYPQEDLTSLERSIAEIRQAMRPNVFGRLMKEGKKMTVADILALV